MSNKDKFIEMDLIPCRGDAACFTTGFMGDEIGRFGQLCADGAAFFVKFGSVNNEDLTPSSVRAVT